MVWGTLNGALLIVESFFKVSDKKGTWLKVTLKTLLTFALICITWIFFRAENIAQAVDIIKRIAQFNGPLFIGSPKDHFYYALIAIFSLMVFEFITEYRPNWYKLIPNNYITRFSYYVVLVVIIMLFGVFGGGQFIYFQF